MKVFLAQFCCSVLSLSYSLFQGTCHGYMQERGRTGGMQDCHCPHLFKIGTKVQALQESVMDPSNIVHSLKKRPILHVLDDPCTLAMFEEIHYPVDSGVCLGDRKGCFEKPSEHSDPTTGVDCKV